MPAETKRHSTSSVQACQNCKNQFTIEPEDFAFYEKVKIPPPSFCPDCRFQRRLTFRNNRVFYRRECALCNKTVLSAYKKESPFTIYCRDCWLSDKWDPMSYGQEYDFSIAFFEQFRSLQSRVPRARNRVVLSYGIRKVCSRRLQPCGYRIPY